MLFSNLLSKKRDDTPSIVWKRIVLYCAYALVLLAVLAFHAYTSWYRAPSAFPVGSVITIPEGVTLSQTAKWLERQQIVRSGHVLQGVVLLLEGERSIQAGDYYFSEELSVVEVAERLISGNYGLTPIRVTVPEGATTYEIADILTNSLGRFDAVTFLAKAREKEGYLFPDTYLFLPNVTTDHILEEMEDNFVTRVGEIEGDFASSTLSLQEVLTMASLLEKEARTTESRKMIAGILYNRLAIDMPLQVDAVFGYINGTNTYSPKFSDLEIDSPYNTYLYKGLPPGPIANPGIDSILAVLHPTPSDYIFYLTGRDGNMYYSETFEQHLRYKRAHLD